MNAGQPQRILILKVDHIGDFFLALPPLVELRHACRDSHITLVCSRSVRQLARSTALFDEIIEFNFFSRDQDDLATVRHAPYASIRDVLPCVYDLAIDLRHDPDTRPLLEYVDARIRAGFQAENLVRPLDLSLPRFADGRSLNSEKFALHAQTRLRLLMTAIIDTFFMVHAPPIMVGHSRTSAVRKIGGQYFVLAPGSGNTLKNWAVHNFALLGKHLIRDLDMSAVLVGGAAETVAAALISATLPENRCVNLTHQLDLIDLPDVLRNSKLFVGNDSGPTHLAASLGVPTVCIFSGVVDPQVWRPRGPNVHVVHTNPPCAPCFLSRESQCRFARTCLEEVSQEMVIEGCERVLEN